MLISDKIRNLRVEKDLTQSDLAKIAGVSPQAVSCWELGTKEPKLQPIHKMCKYFSIDINKFVDTGNDVYSSETDEQKEKPGQIPLAELSEEKQQLIKVVLEMTDERAAALLRALNE